MVPRRSRAEAKVFPSGSPESAVCAVSCDIKFSYLARRRPLPQLSQLLEKDIKEGGHRQGEKKSPLSVGLGRVNTCCVCAKA